MMSTARILIVEDDESIREFIEMGLEDEGYHSMSAADGAIALTLIPTYQPHIILLDLHMPHMDGQAFVEAYRQLPGADAKIIVLTASRHADKVATTIAVDGMLTKPFDLDDLYGAIRAMLPS